MSRTFYHLRGKLDDRDVNPTRPARPGQESPKWCRCCHLFLMIRYNKLCHLVEVVVVKLKPMYKLTPERVNESLPLLLWLEITCAMNICSATILWCVTWGSLLNVKSTILRRPFLRPLPSALQTKIRETIAWENYKSNAAEKPFRLHQPQQLAALGSLPPTWQVPPRTS